MECIRMNFFDTILSFFQQIFSVLQEIFGGIFEGGLGGLFGGSN